MKSLIQKIKDGEVKISPDNGQKTLEEQVEQWHKNAGAGVSLEEFLGLDEGDFSLLVGGGESFFDLATRKIEAQKLVASRSE